MHMSIMGYAPTMAMPTTATQSNRNDCQKEIFFHSICFRNPSKCNFTLEITLQVEHAKEMNVYAPHSQMKVVLVFLQPML
jgi:hypothetical protein